jgi:hypothetical protein
MAGRTKPVITGRPKSVAVQRAAMAAREGKGGFRDLLLAEPGVAAPADQAALLGASLAVILTVRSQPHGARPWFGHACRRRGHRHAAAHPARPRTGTMSSSEWPTRAI